MTHKTFRLFISLMLALTMTTLARGTQSAHAAGPWYVSPTGNDNDDCLSPGTACATINSAIGKSSAGDIINVAEGTYTGAGSEVVAIDRDIALSGGWDETFTTQSGISRIDGQNAIRGITITGVFTVGIERFAVQNSLANGAGGIYNSGGVITLGESIVSGNTSQGGGGGIANVFGGVFIINNSAVTNNKAAIGGGVANTGTSVLTLNNSTISGNSADSRGGGVYNDSGTVHINSTTISANHSTFGPGGGGIYNESGTVTTRNTILAGNTNDQNDGPDCEGTINSLGNTLIGNTTVCNFITDTGDLTNVDPNLGSLIGPSGTPTYQPLLSPSPAIDAGNPAGCTDQDGNLLTTDQRGVARIGICDIGAYEYTVPGTAVRLAVASGDRQTTIATFAFPEPLRAAALDNQGSPVSDVTIAFTAPATGASGTFADSANNTTSVDTNAGGVASTSIFTANDHAGAYTVTASSFGLGSVEFNLEQLARPANDDFASATVITSLPFDDTVDTTNSTIQEGEPTRPSCVFSDLTGSVWYAFTPSTSGSISANAFNFNQVATLVAAYSGNSLTSLTELGCQTFASNQVTFQVEAGATYYIQVGVLGFGLGGPTQFHLDATPPPVAGFFFFPNPPSVFDIVQFFDNSNDPGQVDFQSFTWNFGDGTVSTEANTAHQYTADGDYTVEHSVTTLDGRTASITQTIQVRTHDVSITRITAPKSANVGQTRSIMVSIRNTRYAETVIVELFKDTPAGQISIGTLTLQVPVLTGNRSMQFAFNYTFTSEDAQVGKVTFRAVATIYGANDAFPQDNIVISSPPTKINR